MSKHFPKSHKEIFSDYFNQAVEELANKFSPKTAAEAAQFAMILAGLEALEKKSGIDSEPVKTQIFSVDEENQYSDLARKELENADKYYSMKEYGVANDALNHAAYFLEKARKKAQSKDEQSVIKDLQTRYSLMAQAVNSKLGLS